MAIQIWVNIGSDDGLLPDDTKPSPESMVSSDINLKEISQQIPQLSITKVSLKITYLKFRSNLPGAIGLMVYYVNIMTPDDLR